jgi:hypothetical protein
VLGCGAACLWWVAVLYFIRCKVFSGAATLRFVVPVNKMVHGGTITQEDAREGVGVQCSCLVLCFSCCYFGSKCDESVKARFVARPRFIWGVFY